MENRKKILVIGSQNHKGAECVNWESKIPYLGDFDLVVLNISSLSEDFLLRSGEKLKSMRDELEKAIWSETELVCITAPTVNVLGSENYDWCPIQVIFEEKTGSSFGSPLPSTGYFSKISSWSNFLSSFNESIYSPRFADRFEVKWEHYLTNKASDILAFSFRFREYDPHDYAATRYSKKITFYPPTTRVSIGEGIDLILKDHVDDDEGYKPPEWVSEIKSSEEVALTKEIEDLNVQIKTSQDQIEERKKKLEYLSQFKMLLTEGGEEPSGKRLEQIVEESLSFIGVTVTPGIAGKVDRTIASPIDGLSLPVEIGGMKRSIPEDKLAQLLKWVTAIEYPEKYVGPRGILIANPHRETPLTNKLTGRPGYIDPNNLKRNQEGYSLAIVPTVELFKAVQAKLSGSDISDFVKSIFSTIGLVNFVP